MSQSQIPRQIEQKRVSDGGSLVELPSGTVFANGGTIYVAIPRVFLNNCGITSNASVQKLADFEREQLILEFDDE